jgi:hypothetical protein
MPPGTVEKNYASHGKFQHHLCCSDMTERFQPGSSSTLDNTVPTSVSNEMIAKNPRKKKLKEERAITVERENR